MKKRLLGKGETGTRNRPGSQRGRRAYGQASHGDAAASADGNAEGFAKALADLCAARGIARWEDFVSEDQQRQFFKGGADPLAQRIIAFWSELDELLGLL